MRKKWILIGLTVGLLAAVVTGGVALAWGGPGHGWGWGRGDHGERQSAVASKVAEILGTEAQETEDAIAQAQREVRDEAGDAALQDLAGRVAVTLGTDADATGDAIEKVSQEMFDEALESKLQDAIDDERITEEDAQEYRDKAADMSPLGGGLWSRESDSDEFANRVGQELDAEGDDVASAIEQALADIQADSLEEKIQAAIDNGRITEEEADELRANIESGNWKGYGKRGHHGRRGGKGHWGRGRGHHGSYGRDRDPTATPEPADDGDSA